MLRYLLEDRLRQQKPVLIKQGGFLNLFKQGQVYLVNEAVLKRSPRLLRGKQNELKDLWILMDSRDSQFQRS